MASKDQAAAAEKEQPQHKSPAKGAQPDEKTKPARGQKKRAREPAVTEEDLTLQREEVQRLKLDVERANKAARNAETELQLLTLLHYLDDNLVRDAYVINDQDLMDALEERENESKLAQRGLVYITGLDYRWEMERVHHNDCSDDEDDHGWTTEVSDPSFDKRTGLFYNGGRVAEELLDVSLDDEEFLTKMSSTGTRVDSVDNGKRAYALYECPVGMVLPMKAWTLYKLKTEKKKQKKNGAAKNKEPTVAVAKAAS